jgi:pyruvate formate lyase activating enzyme
MNIAGFQKNSFVDYPGQIASVLFVPGCNLDCYYCHNRHLLGKNTDKVDQDEVFSYLQSRRGFVDAVVISGGEPTIQNGLEDFIKKIKDMGYLIKIDSNGFRPDILEDLIGKRLISYAAVDFKAPYDKYESITRTKCMTDELKKTVRLLMDSDIGYEFRTTFVPDLTTEDLLLIAEEIRGAAYYYIQQFRPLLESDGIIDMRAIKKPHTREYILQTAESVKKFLITTNVFVRGVK